MSRQVLAPLATSPPLPDSTSGEDGEPTPRHRYARLVWGYLAVNIAAIALSRVMPEPLALAALSLVQLGGGIAALAGVRIYRPAKRSGWLLLGIGCLLLGAGAGSWVVYVEFLNSAIPYPGWSDALFVPGYLMLAAALVVMIRQRTPACDISAVLDSLLLAVGLAFANWVFLTGPAVQGALTPGQRIITIVYPMIDVTIAGLVLRLILTADHYSRSLWLLAGGAVTLLGGDESYAVLAGTGSYATGAVPDQLWMLATVFVGAAALHPSMRRVAVQVESKRAGVTRTRLGCMTFAMLVPCVVVAASLLFSPGTHTEALSVTMLAFLPLVAVRTLHLSWTLRRIAVIDDLTGLATRAVVLERLNRRRLNRADDAAVLMFIDLDHFKNVNDTLGHAAGDRILVAVGERLRELVRSEDLVARLSGDEFVIVTGAMADPADADRMADRVVATLAKPFIVNGSTLYLGASVGTAALHRFDAEAILRNADAAMYTAKSAGRSRSVRFTATQIESLNDEAQLDSEFRHALERDELVLHYQPVVDLDSGTISGVEALVRWQHPSLGLLPPAKFLPLAEKNGTIALLGSWVLHEACRQGAWWDTNSPTGRPLEIAVNISALELNGRLVESVMAALVATGLDPKSLVIEVTETALLVNVEEAEAVLTALRAMGVAVALDDFGTGYSSLAFLRAFVVDSLKIDRGFINGLGSDAHDTAIVQAVVGLGTAFGLTVVGEGVETLQQLTLLQSLGCTRAQGFHLSRPVPAEQITDLLAAQVTDAEVLCQPQDLPRGRRKVPQPRPAASQQRRTGLLRAHGELEADAANG